MFVVLSSALQMAVCFKINVKRCSKYVGSEFKDDPAGTAAAIQTRTKPSNPEPKKSERGAIKAGVIIWKDKYLDFK